MVRPSTSFLFFTISWEMDLSIYGMQQRTGMKAAVEVPVADSSGFVADWWT